MSFRKKPLPRWAIVAVVVSSLVSANLVGCAHRPRGFFARLFNRNAEEEAVQVAEAEEDEAVTPAGATSERPNARVTANTPSLNADDSDESLFGGRQRPNSGPPKVAEKGNVFRGFISRLPWENELKEDPFLDANDSGPTNTANTIAEVPEEKRVLDLDSEVQVASSKKTSVGSSGRDPLNRKFDLANHEPAAAGNSNQNAFVDNFDEQWQELVGPLVEQEEYFPESPDEHFQIAEDAAEERSFDDGFDPFGELSNETAVAHRTEADSETTEETLLSRRADELLEWENELREREQALQAGNNDYNVDVEEARRPSEALVQEPVFQSMDVHAGDLTKESDHLERVSQGDTKFRVDRFVDVASAEDINNSMIVPTSSIPPRGERRSALPVSLEGAAGEIIESSSLIREPSAPPVETTETPDPQWIVSTPVESPRVSVNSSTTILPQVPVNDTTESRDSRADETLMLPMVIPPGVDDSDDTQAQATAFEDSAPAPPLFESPTLELGDKPPTGPASLSPVEWDSEPEIDRPTKSNSMLSTILVAALIGLIVLFGLIVRRVSQARVVPARPVSP